MKILVYGAGAVGSVLGGLVARTGHDVTLVGRKPHLDAIDRAGLHITGLWGEYRIKSFDLFESIDAIPEERRAFDLILFTLKSFDTEKGIADVARVLGSNTTLLSFQNGLTNVEAILKRVPGKQFLAGRIITGVEIEPGRVHVTVSADDLVIGSPTGDQTPFPASQAAHLFRFARVPAREVADIFTHIWAKAIYNCALNAPCAALKIPYGEMLATPERRAQMSRIVREAYAVGLKKKIALDPASPDAFLEWLEKTLIPRTASHFPSMIRDIERHRPTEIDSLNAAIAKWGAELGIPTPENAAIAARIRETERV